MIFHENRLLADDYPEISFLISFKNSLGKKLQNLLSAAVMIGALRVSIENQSDLNLAAPPNQTSEKKKPSKSQK